MQTKWMRRHAVIQTRKRITNAIPAAKYTQLSQKQTHATRQPARNAMKRLMRMMPMAQQCWSAAHAAGKPATHNPQHQPSLKRQASKGCFDMRPRGNQLPHAKLTPELVIQIRQTAFAKSAEKWAAELNLHPRTIEKARSYGSWAHVKQPKTTGAYACQHQH